MAFRAQLFLESFSVPDIETLVEILEGCELEIDATDELVDERSAVAETRRFGRQQVLHAEGRHNQRIVVRLEHLGRLSRAVIRAKLKGREAGDKGVGIASANTPAQRC